MKNEEHHQSKKRRWLFIGSICSIVLLVTLIGFRMSDEDNIKKDNDPNKTKLPSPPTEDIYDVSQLEIDMAASKAKREEDARKREIELAEKIKREKELEKMQADSIRRAKRDSIKNLKLQNSKSFEKQWSDSSGIR
ncbi:MAG: hypothetical protein ACKOYC_06740 [Bacteroidota bacterium]